MCNLQVGQLLESFRLAIFICLNVVFQMSIPRIDLFRDPKSFVKILIASVACIDAIIAAIVPITPAVSHVGKVPELGSVSKTHLKQGVIER